MPSDDFKTWHFKHVVEMLSRLARVHEFDRLILAGTTEATSELSGLLVLRRAATLIRLAINDAAEPESAVVSKP